jgi:hypothetical protein
VAGRLDKHLVVRPQRPVRELEVIESHQLVYRDPVAEDLPRAGHAWGQVEPASAEPTHFGILIDHDRSRAQQAHLSAHNVEELWELVERGAGDHSPDGGDARAIRDLEQAAL